jgi:hypothetical protein
MKTKYLACALAVVVLLMGAGIARAELLWSYDFDSLTTVLPTSNTQNLIGQDGWKLWPATYLTGHQVVASPTPALSNGNVLKQPLNIGNPGGICVTTRPIGPFTFTSADTAIEQSFWLNAGQTSSIYGGITFSTQSSPGTGSSLALATGENNQFPPGNPLRVKVLPNNYGNPAGGSGKVYDAYISQTNLTFGDWYEFKGVMDFSVPGIQVSWYMRDVTLGQTDFSLITFDKYDVALSPPYPIKTPNMTSLNMAMPANGDGSYTANAVTVMSQRGSSYNVYADNFKLVNPVPEPSTLALFGLGLTGLLAYAWRKRK